MESGEHDRPLSAIADLRRESVLTAVEDGIRSLGNDLIDAFPAIRTPVVRAWYGYTYLYIRAAAVRNALRHEAPIDPFAIYWVDVDRIHRKIPSLPESKFKYAGRVMGGDWDRAGRPFEETDVYRGFEAHFEDGVDWTETAFFDRVVGQIEGGQPMWGCRTREEFERRCAELDALKERIETEGYKTQAELAAEADDEVIEKGRHTALERFLQDEMTVSVARDGELLFNDGRDRLAIAKIVGLEAVPVWILLRHEEWQRRRDGVAAGEIPRESLPDRLCDHPDIDNIPDPSRR